MPSGVGQQPPSRGRPRPQPARRRPAPRSRVGEPRRRVPPPPVATAEDEDATYDEAYEEAYDEGYDEGYDDRYEERAPRRGGRRPPPRAARERERSSRKVVILLSILSLIVVSLGVYGVVLATHSSPKKSQGAAPDDTPVPVTSFHDDQTGTTVEYPRSWQKIPVPVADYRLAVDGGSNVAFTIRVVPIATQATAANLENFKAVTDGLVTSNDTVQVLKQQAVSLNGMLGYYYFYTFTDGGVSAVHAHYFLFSGYKMNVLVFQALPDDFARLAPTFDKIAESFRSDPNVGAPAPSTSTSVP